MKLASEGWNGLRPSAIISALTKTGQPASFGRNFFAKLVFPDPLGPAIIKILFFSTIGNLACFQKLGLKLQRYSLTSRPMPSISTSTVHPRGIGPSPTEVPQQITSPGHRVIFADNRETVSIGDIIMSEAG